VLQRSLGQYDAALDSLRSAHWLAEGERHERLAASAAAELVFIAGLQGNVPEGMEWSEHARASLRRVGDDAEIEAVLLNGLGTVQWSAGDHEAAGESFAGAVQLRMSIFGEHSYEVARIRANLALNHVKLGRIEAGLHEQHRAIDAAREDLGPRHPSLAHLMLNLASIEVSRGDYVQAIAHYHQALELRPADQPTQRSVAILGGLGIALHLTGEHRQAFARQQQAVELASRSLAKDLLPAEILHQMGQAQLYLEEYPAALASLKRAHRIYLETLGDSHITVAFVEADLAQLHAHLHPADPLATQEALAKTERVYDMLDPSASELAVFVRLSIQRGNLHHEAGQIDQALDDFQRAHVRALEALPDDHPFVLDLEANLGMVEADQGRWATAAQRLDRVLQRHEAAPAIDPLNVASVRFDLSRALWHDPARRARAIELATSAAEVPGDFPAHHRLRRRASEWLEAHDGP